MSYKKCNLRIFSCPGVNIDDVDSETVMPTAKKRTLNDEEQYNEDLRFNANVRETFLNRFVNMFLMYENFVIMPDQVCVSYTSCFYLHYL